MTTNSLHSLLKLQNLDTNNYTTTLFLKPNKPISNLSTCTTTSTYFSLSVSSSTNITTTSFSVSPTTTTTTPTTSPDASSLELLETHLAARNYRKADEETRRLLIVLAGEAAQKRGYVFFSEVQFISADDLKAIDDLWRKYSDDKFGYSVQSRIWKQKANKDFTKFFLKVGWMKKLDTEVEQYNYRSFPDEFTWELDETTLEGHLPLTNALRGTQLLNSILTHPAFDVDEDESPLLDNDNGGTVTSTTTAASSKPLTSTKRVFKTDYSF